jgi:hypothetical protein
MARTPAPGNIAASRNTDDTAVSSCIRLGVILAVDAGRLVSAASHRSSFARGGGDRRFACLRRSYYRHLGRVRPHLSGKGFCWGINAYGEMGITPSGLTTRYTHFSADGDGSALVHDRQAFTARFAA